MTTFDKNIAAIMRTQGFSYGEISDKLGCSEIWCKKNLKSFDKNTLGKHFLNKVLIQSSENKYFDEDDLKNLMLIEGFTEQDHSEVIQKTMKYLKTKMKKAVVYTVDKTNYTKE